MDAAQKLLKNLAILASCTLLFAMVGLAQPQLIVPTGVTMVGTGGQDVTVTSSAAGTTEISYTIGAPVYLDSAGSWLGVTGGTTTPALLSFSLARAPLTGGSHQATVTLTPTSPSTAAAVTITVTYNPGSGTGGSSTLAASLNPVNLTAAVNGSAQATVSITTTSISAITIGMTTAVTGASSNWLSYSTLSSSSISSASPVTLTVNASAYNLSSANYVGTITLTPSSGTALAITVNFSVGTGSNNGTWSANPGSINWSYTLNSGSFPSQAVTIATSSGAATYNVGTSSDINHPWLQVYTASIAATTGFTGVPIGTQLGVTIGSQANALAAGLYYGYVYISDPGNLQQLTLGVTLTVSSNGANTLTVSPNPVSISVALNGSPLSQNVNVYSSGGGYLSVSCSCPAGLSVQAPSNTYVNAGGTINFTVYANPSGLAALTYSGTLNIYVGSQYSQVPVSMVVGGSSSTGLTVTPNPITFNLAVNGSQQSQTVNVYSSTGGTFSMNAYFPSGLSYQLPSYTTVAAGGTIAFTVFANPSGLAANTYSGTLYIYVGSQSATVSVSMVVGSGGTSGLTVSPNPITFSLPVNGSQQSQVVNVYSSTGGTLSLNANFPSGMSYQLPSNTFVAAGGTVALTVYANPSGLTANTYSGYLYVYVGSQSVTVPVSMVVGGGGGTGTTGTTAVAPTTINLNYQLGTDPVNSVAWPRIAITGPAGSWSSTVSTLNGIPWLKLNPSSGGSLPTAGDFNSAPVVNIDASQLPNSIGSYYGTITITTPGGSQSISVSLNAGTGTVLLPTPGSLIFGAKTGQGDPPPAIVYFSGSDAGLNPLTLTATANNSFITGVTVDNNSHGVSVQVSQAGLSSGTYSGSVSVQAGSVTTVVPVILVVNSGGGGGTPTNSNVTVTPTSLSFSTSAGTNPQSQTLNVTSTSGSASISFTVQATTTSGGNWLSASVSSGSTPLNPLTVSVNSASLAAGSYNGTIVISPTGGTAVSIPVSLTIAVATSVTATPTSLSFNYRAGDPAPASQTITVSGGSGLAFSATASSTGGWLSVSPASGATPGTVAVSVNAAGLSANTYSGTVTVAGASGAVGTTTINVSLTVTASLPTVTKVTNAASYATGSVSPGEIITLFASDTNHPIGPSTPAGLTLDSNGNVATTIGGVTVTVNGYPCPMIYASATQISAVVPYEIKQFLSATVLVKFLGNSSNGVTMNVATTVPGIFTANSSGTGPGAILNSNGSVNAPSNPAARGDTVVVYLTGEGETSPFGVTGKVTTVAAPPQPLTPGPLLQPTVTIGGQPANWSFAGEAPGFVSGVMQLNVTVPSNIAAGDQPIVVSFGGTPSQQGVTVSVK